MPEGAAKIVSCVKKYHSLYQNSGDTHDISEHNTVCKNKQTHTVTRTASHSHPPKL